MSQRRYTSAFEIEVDIVKAKRDAIRLGKEMDALYKQAEEWLARARDPAEKAPQWCYDRWDETKKRAEAAGASITHINEHKIPSLGRTLAAFRTMTFDFMGEDRAVVKQK